MHEWARVGALDELRRGLALFGLESLGAVEDAPAEVVALAEARVAAGPRRTSPRPIGSATRSVTQAGRCATPAPSTSS